MPLSASALALLLAAAPAGGGEAGIEAALQRPLSPGAVALLIAQVRDPRAGARLVEALTHDRADVRAAAARVAGIVGLRQGLPVLRQAVARESEASAGLEQVKALALLEEAAAQPELLRAVAGVGPAGLDTWASTRAQARPGLLLDELPALRAAGLGQEQLLGLVRQAASRDPQVATRARESAVASGDAALWAAASYAAWSAGQAEDLGQLAQAVTVPALREAALWWVAALREAPPRGSPLATVIEGLLAGEGASSLPLELAARRLGRPPVDRSSELRTLPRPALPPLLDFAYRAGRQPLTAEEQKAVESRDDVPPGYRMPERPALPSATRGFERSLRMAGPYPAGYAADTLAVAGCQLDGRLAGGMVFYRDDGRPREVKPFNDLGASPACLTAVAALLASLHEGPRRAAREGEVVLLPLDRDVLSCRASAPPQPRGSARSPRRLGGSIQEPRKVHHVNPLYPEAAKHNRIQGLVVLEAELHVVRLHRDAGAAQGSAPRPRRRGAASRGRLALHSDAARRGARAGDHDDHGQLQAQLR